MRFSRSAPIGRETGSQSCDLPHQNGKIVLYGLPHDVVINTEIYVHDVVPHTTYFPPVLCPASSR